MQRRTGRWVLGAVVLAVLAGSVTVTAACSDDGDDITKAQLLRRGDAICRKQMAELADKARRAEGNESNVISAILLPGFKKMIDEVEALGTPSGDEDELNDIYDRVDDVLTTSGRRTDSRKVSAELTQISKDMKAYGFEVCGQSPTG